jgi:hypothetical protein
MNDGITVASVLLVVGPVVGGVGASSPALFRVWSASREEHLATILAHRRAWMSINAGFAIATLMTAAGLNVLAGALDVADGPRAVLAAAAVVYAIAGALWCSVLAIRTRTTPALAAMVAAGTQTEPAETLLGETLGGLFAAFLLATSAALLTVGIGLGLGGAVAAPVAWFAIVVAVVAVVGFFVSGDMVPAVLYPATLLIGLALLLGWR